MKDRVDGCESRNSTGKVLSPNREVGNCEEKRVVNEGKCENRWKFEIYFKVNFPKLNGKFARILRG